MNEDIKMFFALGAILGAFIVVIFAADYLSMRNKAECRQIMAQKSATEIIAICGVLK